MAQKYTEDMIARPLFQYLDAYRCKIPNFYWARYESDLLALDHNGFWTDYEIKCTRADFLNDFKKGLQDRPTAKEEAAKKAREIAAYGHELATRYYPTKHEIYSQKIEHKHWFPNYLVYVLPVGLIEPREVPAYAGIIEFDSRLTFSVARRKKKIHALEMPVIKMQNALTSMSYRLHDMYTHLERMKAELARLRG